MAIDPISGAVLAEPGIAPPSATGVSQWIDQIGASLTQIAQTWVTPTPPAGATYAPVSMLGGSLVPMLLLGGGAYLLTRASRSGRARNPHRRRSSVGSRRHGGGVGMMPLLAIGGLAYLYMSGTLTRVLPTTLHAHPYLSSHGHKLFD